MTYVFYIQDYEKAFKVVEDIIPDDDYSISEIPSNGWLHYESKDSDWIIIDSNKWKGILVDFIHRLNETRPVALFVDNANIKEVRHQLLINNIFIDANEYESLV